MTHMKFRAALLLTGVTALSGCVTTPPEADPVVQKLTELECELMQGFEFSRPLPSGEAWKLFHPDAG